ncbi:hypothetical protein COLO4_19181 [Corchorus olitorius]|uniref:Uncharacterized protein n=1 Tax=Corchorus olitorius TaxID=93759 RepID=A0A1R3J6I8_9ROSI|nr:hypothetical protein COLO4_19181 [Corchorus olitorius]
MGNFLSILFLSTSESFLLPGFQVKVSTCLQYKIQSVYNPTVQSFNSPYLSIIIRISNFKSNYVPVEYPYPFQIRPTESYFKFQTVSKLEAFIWSFLAIQFYCLKAEYPPATPGKGCDQRRSGTSVSPILRASRLEGNRLGTVGSQSVPSKSVTGGGGGFRHRVDSLALNGRRENRGHDLQRGRSGHAIEDSVGYVGREILRQLEAKSRENLLIEGEGKSRGGKEGHDAESSNNSHFNHDFIPLQYEMGSGSAIGPSGMGVQSIPGVGLSSMGPRVIGAGSQSVGLDIGSGSKAYSTINAPYKQANTGVVSTKGYDPDSPFVFGAGVSEGMRTRKWKKTARGTQTGSVDLVCQETLGSIGQKRATIGTGRQLSIHGGSVKRFRESDMEVSGAGVPLDKDAENIRMKKKEFEQLYSKVRQAGCSVYSG